MPGPKESLQRSWRTGSWSVWPWTPLPNTGGRWPTARPALSPSASTTWSDKEKLREKNLFAPIKYFPSFENDF